MHYDKRTIIKEWHDAEKSYTEEQRALRDEIFGFPEMNKNDLALTKYIDEITGCVEISKNNRIEVLDKNHPEISSYKNGGEKKFINFGVQNTIYISNGAVVYWKIQENRYIHFVIKDNKLYFYCDMDMESGFSLSKTKSGVKDCAYKVTSKKLIFSLKKRFNINEKDKFYLMESSQEYQDKILIQVMIERPIKKCEKTLKKYGDG